MARSSVPVRHMTQAFIKKDIIPSSKPGAMTISTFLT
mgnify:CR=1